MQDKYIYTAGCIDKVSDWVNVNMIPVAGTAVGVAVVEVRFTIVYAACIMLCT